MSGDLSNDQIREKSDPAEENSAGEGRGALAPKKGFFSAIKGYLIIILLTVLVFIGVNSYARSGGGDGGCGGCAARGAGALYPEEQMRRLGLEYYAENYGDFDVEAVVRDFGCHQEIHIFKSGELVKRLYYLNGRLYELPEV